MPTACGAEADIKIKFTGVTHYVEDISGLKMEQLRNMGRNIYASAGIERDVGFS